MLKERKVFMQPGLALCLLLIMCSVQNGFSQDVRFKPFTEATIKGTYYDQKQIRDNGIVNVRRPAMGGLSFVANYLESDGLKTYEIGGLMKKKLFTDVQITTFYPVMLDGKLYDVTVAKGYKEVALIGRDKTTFDLTGEEIIAWSGKEKLFNYGLLTENESYFALVDMTALYPTGEPSLMKALVFDKQNVKNPYTVNFEGGKAALQTYLGFNVTPEGSFFSMTTPTSKMKMSGAVAVSEELDVEFHTSQGKRTASYTFSGGLGVLKGTGMYETASDVFVNAVLLDGTEGLKLSVLKLNDGDLTEVSSKDLPYDLLYADNESEAAANFRNRIKEKRGGIELEYSAGAGDLFDLKDGGVLSAVNINMNKIRFLLLSRISASGEIQWVKCVPSGAVAHLTTDVNDVLHVFLNDATSNYDASGKFLSYSDASVAAKKSPVHLAVNSNGEVVERGIMKDGFDKDECFDISSSMYVIEKDGQIVLPKSTCANSATATCPSITYGVIDLNP